MPSEELSLPAEDKVDDVAVAAGPVKANAHSSKGGHTGESRKMAKGSGQAATKSSHLASEGEKDSGFSDVSSEYLSTMEQTDSEDQPPSESLHRLPKWPKRAPPPKAPGGLVAGGAFPGLTPVYIVKNVILKQPLGTSQATQFLAWGGHHPLNGAQGSPARVLFIQPPVASLKPLLPGRTLPSRDTYLPILSTYPKIAPHPGPDRQAKGAAEGGPLPAGGTSKNKRFCLEEAWVSSSEPAAPKTRDSGDKQSSGEVPALPPPLPSGRPPPQLLGTEPLLQNAVTSSSSRLEQAEGRMLSRASKKLSSSSSLGKQRRFHNTVEILRKSGLLGITLRTKELLRQNGSTQRELSEVREHARLFCEAMQSNDGQAWARLQQAMSRSSAYWAARGAKDPLGHLAGMPSRTGELDGPVPEDAVGKSPPCSPMNLSLAPDNSVQVAMP